MTLLVVAEGIGIAVKLDKVAVRPAWGEASRPRANPGWGDAGHAIVFTAFV
jgi:hypothetical protein